MLGGEKIIRNANKIRLQLHIFWLYLALFMECKQKNIYYVQTAKMWLDFG